MIQLKKKFCLQCGQEAQFSAKFCGACGAKLDSLEPITKQAEIKTTKASSYFAPFVPGEDDDDKTIRADRINSISELGLSISSLDVNLGLDRPAGEKMGSVIQQGSQMPQGYKESPRPVAPVDQKAFLQQFQQEAGPSKKTIDID